MGVKREVIEKPRLRGGAVPIRASRSLSGAWSVDVQVYIDVQLQDGRTVRAARQVRVRAEQIGRKKMSIRFIPRRRGRSIEASEGKS